MYMSLIIPFTENTLVSCQQRLASGPADIYSQAVSVSANETGKRFLRYSTVLLLKNRKKFPTALMLRPFLKHLLLLSPNTGLCSRNPTQAPHS